MIKPLIVFTLAVLLSGSMAHGDTADANAEAMKIKRGIARQQCLSGVAAMNDHQWDQALSCFKTCLSYDPDNLEALTDCGLIMVAKGDDNDALPYLADSIRLCPTNAVILLDRGNIYRARYQYEKSLADFNACLRLDPTNALAYQGRASAYVNLGRYQKAIDDASESLKFAPGDGMTYLVRADTYDRKHQYAEARADYEKAVGLLPGNSDVYNDYAWFLATCPDANLRDGTKAALLAGLACDQTSWKRWTYVDTAAVAFATASNFDKAITCEQQVLQSTNLDRQSKKDVLQRLELFKKHQPYHE